MPNREATGGAVSVTFPGYGAPATSALPGSGSAQLVEQGEIGAEVVRGQPMGLDALTGGPLLAGRPDSGRRAVRAPRCRTW